MESKEVNFYEKKAKNKDFRLKINENNIKNGKNYINIGKKSIKLT